MITSAVTCKSSPATLEAPLAHLPARPKLRAKSPSGAPQLHYFHMITHASGRNPRVLISIRRIPGGGWVLTFLKSRRCGRRFAGEAAARSAGQQVARQAETFERTQHGYGNLFGLEKLPGDLL